MYKRLLAVGITVMLGISLFAGCTRWASKETLAEMEQACKAADDAEAKVGDLQNQLNALNAEKEKLSADVQSLQEQINKLPRKPERGE